MAQHNLGTQLHHGSRYTYSTNDQREVFQSKDGGPNVWFCSYSAWESALHKVCTQSKPCLTEKTMSDRARPIAKS
jgi:hypothetical protein